MSPRRGADGKRRSALPPAGGRALFDGRVGIHSEPSDSLSTGTPVIHGSLDRPQAQRVRRVAIRHGGTSRSVASAPNCAPGRRLRSCRWHGNGAHPARHHRLDPLRAGRRSDRPRSAAGAERGATASPGFGSGQGVPHRGGCPAFVPGRSSGRCERRAGAHSPRRRWSDDGVWIAGGGRRRRRVGLRRDPERGGPPSRRDL